ncbi:MAG: hypothetical protein FJ272_15665, partial [Planctomycetes bacterium]|nr:hypothetical protein [Planctomycetota bacterium]
ENSTAEWPGPFGDPQTNTYALADEPGARPVPMRELYVGVRTAKPSAPPPRKPNPNAIALAKEARVFATEGLSNAESKVEHLTDGNPATFWHGSGTPLPQSPANILVLFSKPETICEVTIASQVFKEVLRLKDFEVYARSGQDWAGATPLAVVKDCKDVTVTCAFDPVTTDAVRVRLRDTWRPDHAYPRVCEIEVARAEPGVRGRQLQPSPIADEAEYERLLCDWAMGIKRQYPGATFEPDKGYLHYARTFVDAMLAKGTDIYGDAHSPMLVSILMLPSQKHPGQPLASVPGQRTGDRAPFGGNLFHDVMLLQAMDLLSAVTGEPKYKAAADAYLRYFLEHCPRKETGLFPWGEHAHWDFYKDAPGHTTHEYLGGIPISFWERLWRLKPEAVIGEANGLINHVVDLETFAWNRHADITKPLTEPRPKGLSPADFPRHGGFYVLPWTFAHSKTKDPKYLDWSLRAIEHHWRLKKAPLNLPPITAGANQANMESAFSLAICLLEAAALLPKGPPRARYEEVAHTYLDAIALMPHKPAEGCFLTNCKLDARASEATGETLPWTAAYGGKFTADDALLCCAAYRLTAKPVFLQLAKDAARFYATHEPPKADEIVWAHVYAAILNLFLDLHDQTRDPDCLTQAKRYAKLAIERLYYNGLFRGATGVNHYDSQLMVSNLVYGLVWLHVAEKGLAV